MSRGSPLRIVLGGGAPHQGVLEVCNERLVDLPAQRLYAGPPSVRRHDHGVRKVRLPAHLMQCIYAHVRMALSSDAWQA